MNRWLSIVGVAAMGTAALATCTVGPNYAPPKLRMDGTFGDPNAPPPSAATRPATRPAASEGDLTAWWEGMGDPVLDALVRRAASANLDIRVAAAHLSEARSREAVTRGGAYPSANLDGQYTYQRFSQNAAPYNAFDIPGFPWEFNLYEPGFDASWEIDVFGGTRRSIEAARADSEAGVEDQRAALVSVTAEVALNYIALRGYQEELALARHNLRVQQESLDLTKNQSVRGVGTQLDVSRAEAQVAATQAALPALERQAWEAIYRLSVLLNEPVEKLDYLREPSPLPGVPDRIAVGVPAELLRRRPDIRRAERQLAAATARIGEAQAALYPRFSLTGVFNLQSASLDDLFDWKSRAFSLGPTVRWPIFDAGALRAAVGVRTAQKDAALATYELTVRNAVAEVRESLVAFTTERQRQASLAEAVKADEDAVDLARQLYGQGLTDFLNVLDAERQLYSAQDAKAQSDATEAAALVSLYRSLGGGWDTDVATTRPSP